MSWLLKFRIPAFEPDDSLEPAPLSTPASGAAKPRVKGGSLGHTCRMIRFSKTRKTAQKPPAHPRRKAQSIAGLTILVLAFLTALAVSKPPPAGSVTEAVTAAPGAPGTQSPSLPVVPPDAKPLGERNPLIGFLAAGSIVVAAVAGIYVYRVIRKGL